MKVLRKLGCCLQIEVGIVSSLCRNGHHQVISFVQVPEIVESVVVIFKFMSYQSSVTIAKL